MTSSELASGELPSSKLPYKISIDRPSVQQAQEAYLLYTERDDHVGISAEVRGGPSDRAQFLGSVRLARPHNGHVWRILNMWLCHTDNGDTDYIARQLTVQCLDYVRRMDKTVTDKWLYVMPADAHDHIFEKLDFVLKSELHESDATSSGYFQGCPGGGRVKRVGNK